MGRQEFMGSGIRELFYFIILLNTITIMSMSMIMITGEDTHEN